MKIAEISKLKFSDGKEKWRVNLENDKKALWLDTTKFPTPPFKVGDDIPGESLQLSQSGKGYVLRLNPNPSPKSQPLRQENRSDEIFLSVAFKGACECEGYWYVPDGKAHPLRVLDNTVRLFRGLQQIRENPDVNLFIEEAKSITATEKKSA